MKTVKDYIVTENPNWIGDSGRYKIYKREYFEWIPFCKTYDEYGQRNDSDYCHGQEDENGDPIDCNHYEVFAYTYWDGSNWKTVFIGDETEGFIHEIDGDTANKILAEMPEVPFIDGIHEEIDTDNYTYYFDRCAREGEICSVR